MKSKLSAEVRSLLGPHRSLNTYGAIDGLGDPGYVVLLVGDPNSGNRQSGSLCKFDEFVRLWSDELASVGYEISDLLLCLEFAETSGPDSRKQGIFALFLPGEA